jgi:hypothetical protein
VAVINENDIWAVGEIHTEETDRFDSLGNWVQPYNAAHWNGVEWDLKRIYVNYRGQPNLAPLKGVKKISEDKIVFSSGLPYLPEGDHWKLYHLWDMGILDQNDGSVFRIWGNTLDNLYFVGNNGTIVHYNGSTWQKLESGTTIDLLDVYGSLDGSVVWACGFDDLEGSVLVKNTGSGFETVARVDDPNGAHLHNIITYVFNTIWTNNSDSVFVGSVGRIYNTPVNYNFFARENVWFDYPNSTTYPNTTHAIRGNAENDIFIAGYQNEIRHYNGKTWQNYIELLSSSGTWYALSVKNNLVVAAGVTTDQKALIGTGIR